MLNAANAPLVPERTTRAPLNSSKDRKRKSLPANPQHESLRWSRNSVVVKPASPEVITSLIETLSAISSPAEHHFNNFPSISASRSTPVSPSPWDSNFPLSGSGALAPSSPLATGFGTDDDSVNECTSSALGNYLHPGHATIKRVSPKPIPLERSLGQNTREAAYEDLLDDAYSIGNVSIEPGVAVDPPPKQPIQRKSLKSLRSARSFRSLTVKHSGDSLRKSEIYVHPKSKNDSEPKNARLFIPDSPSPSSSPRKLTVKKRDIAVHPFDLLHNTDSIGSLQPSATSKRLYLDSEDTSSSAPSQSKRSSYNFPHQDFIPTRDSSKRHSSSFAIRKQKATPQRSEHSPAPESGTDAGDEQFHTPPTTPPPATPGIDEASVNRRIEELKEQKANRDRLSKETASDRLILSIRTSRSPSPSPLPIEPPNDRQSAQTVIPETTSLGLEAPMAQEAYEKSAPSPTIPQRIQRSQHSRVNSRGSNPTVVATAPSASKCDNVGAAVKVPQRTNSKLLRRLSQAPASPVSAERSRRRFSNPLGYNPSNRNPSYQTESGDSIDDAVGDYLSSPRFSQKITHPQTGRVISFSEVGDPDGSVVFCCVGMGLTRYITTFYDELAAALKLRLVTPDRPGVGDSEPYADGKDTPLGWPDDVRTICEHRGITKFSIIAHSAGAIYALATALRMPQHIRCRVHLLAPWIPPSQMSAMGTQQEPLPSTAMPYTQRFLRSLPTTFLRAANSSFLSITSNSITTSLPRSPRRSKRSMSKNTPLAPSDPTTIAVSFDSPSLEPKREDQSHDKENRPPLASPGTSALIDIATENPIDERARRTTYEARLASGIWDAATTNANASVDLLVCLERKQAIGFRYVDITRAVVIHHGSKDSRVPIDNVKWLGKMMRR
ncbi:MAG: hypothetical protein Q9164_004172, partial [Protoblastenia rupestris]